MRNMMMLITISMWSKTLKHVEIPCCAWIQHHFGFGRAESHQSSRQLLWWDYIQVRYQKGVFKSKPFSNWVFCTKYSPARVLFVWVWETIWDLTLSSTNLKKYVHLFKEMSILFNTNSKVWQNDKKKTILLPLYVWHFKYELILNPFMKKV